MRIIQAVSGRNDYVGIVRLVAREGTRRDARGLTTLDLGPTTIVYRSARDALPVGVGRNLNPAIAAGEAVQLIAGRARHDLMPKISSNFTRFVEPDGHFWGAYGDRIGDQVDYCIRTLQADPDSRRAVINLWSAPTDNEPGKRDYPCTVALNFALIRGKLELRTLMRSNDVWLGLPYDVFQFTQLQLTVARALGAQAGPYTHTVWSLHIYTEHIESVSNLAMNSQLETYPEAQFLKHAPQGFGKEGHAWAQARIRASAVLNGFGNLKDPTDSERWYVDALAPYVG